MTSRVLLMIALSVVAVPLIAAKTSVQRDPAFDFSTLTTWAWNPVDPGQVKMVTTADAKAEPVERKYEPVLLAAVEERLAARGYTRVPADAASFTVTYHILITIGMSAQEMGQFLPTNATWGLQLFTPQTQSVEIYPQGTLALDMARPGRDGLIWRGFAEARIEQENTEPKRAARLKSIVKELVDKFPRKGSKG